MAWFEPWKSVAGVNGVFVACFGSTIESHFFTYIEGINKIETYSCVTLGLPPGTPSGTNLIAKIVFE